MFQEMDFHDSASLRSMGRLSHISSNSLTSRTN